MRHVREFNVIFERTASRGGREGDEFDTSILAATAREARSEPILKVMGIIDIRTTSPPCHDAVLFEVFRGGSSKGYAFVRGGTCQLSEVAKCPAFRDPRESWFGEPLPGRGICLYEERLGG